jgi:hypothetical protein
MTSREAWRAGCLVRFRIELDGHVGETANGEMVLQRNTTESGGRCHAGSVEQKR